ncbi:MAG: hypothetical protein KF812_08240, partial [Fimbriimonadaceae bacterium]|nr:hypothetical protein [Fimbriimonadaceae bacterium]
VKAFAERNIRWLFLRPSSLGGEKPLTEFETLIARVRQGVAHEKGAVRSPRPFAEPVVLPLLIPFLCAVSTLAIAGVLFAFPVARGWQIAGLLGVCLVGVGAAMGNAIGYLAFLVAVAAPMAAYAWWATRRAQPGFVGAIVMGAICVGGGLIVAGMLNDLPYYIQLKMFTGVKVAHFAPIAIVAVLLLNRLVPLRKIAQEPMRYGPVVLGFVGLAIVAFMMSRTGNDSPTGVSGVELQFRSLLDAVLPVRPRTKEFMFGHPALVLGLMFLKRDPKSVWGSVLLGAGFIGLTSVINTLCHLHSPLALNLTRIAVGAVLGLTLGLALWWLLGALGFVRTAGEQESGSESMGDQARS